MPGLEFRSMRYAHEAKLAARRAHGSQLKKVFITWAASVGSFSPWGRRSR
jgi:hypothetical protein